MRKLWSSTGLLALMSFGVWFTIIFARTNGFYELLHDSTRAFAIGGSALAMMVFGIALNRMFGDRVDNEDENL